MISANPNMTIRLRKHRISNPYLSQIPTYFSDKYYEAFGIFLKRLINNIPVRPYPGESTGMDKKYNLQLLILRYHQILHQ